MRARAFVIVIPRATSIERVDINVVRKNLERNEKNLRQFCSLFDESDDESDIYISACRRQLSSCAHNATTYKMVKRCEDE